MFIVTITPSFWKDPMFLLKQKKKEFSNEFPVYSILLTFSPKTFLFSSHIPQKEQIFDAWNVLMQCAGITPVWKKVLLLPGLQLLCVCCCFTTEDEPFHEDEVLRHIGIHNGKTKSLFGRENDTFVNKIQSTNMSLDDLFNITPITENTNDPQKSLSSFSLSYQIEHSLRVMLIFCHGDLYSATHYNPKLSQVPLSSISCEKKNKNIFL